MAATTIIGPATTVNSASAAEGSRSQNRLNANQRGTMTRGRCTRGLKHEIFREEEEVKSYAPPTARIGIVTPVEASDEANMWQRPSKIPPGSTTMHGERT